MRFGWRSPGPRGVEALLADSLGVGDDVDDGLLVRRRRRRRRPACGGAGWGVDGAEQCEIVARFLLHFHRRLDPPTPLLLMTP